MRNATAIILVRNEQFIIPVTIGYLLNMLGVHRILVADNGSTDATRIILQRLCKADERVRWLDASGPYLQQEITNGLMREACHNGADWIIPNDADEFFWFGGRKLQELEIAPKTGALLLDVRNFVPWYCTSDDYPHALERLVFSADPIGEQSDAQRLVEKHEIAFLQIKYPPKLMLRASVDTVIHKGNHDAEGVMGERVWRQDAQVLHAPLRARNNLLARLEKARRIEELGAQGTESWHLRRLLRMDQTMGIDEEWRANSTLFGRIGTAGRKRRLSLDLRLRWIAQRQRSFAARVQSG
jgi:glycosyltransferase involved in cell wall biosynthesis